MSLCRSCDILQRTRRSFSSSNKAVSPPITHFVFGANTDIGKTVLTAALIRAASAERTDKSCSATSIGTSTSTTRSSTHYIKPLQCGGSDESFVRKHAPNHLSSATTLFEWDTPASPHFAARFEEKPVADEQVLKALSDRLRALENLSSSLPDASVTAAHDNISTNHEAGSSSGGCSTTNRSSIWIETAGGVLSPSSSSPENRFPHHARNGAGGWGWVTQADLYRGFNDRSSVVLIGDGRLGGISSTLASLEAILHRNYSVGGILLIRNDANDDDSVSYDSNLDALREYVASYSSSSSGDGIPPCTSTSTSTSSLFANPEKSILSLPALPPEPEPLHEWFASSDVQGQMTSFVHEHLFDSYGMNRA